MYNPKDVANYILEGKPLLAAKKPTIYQCSGLELTDVHTGETISVSLKAAEKLIPLVFSDSITDSTSRISNMAALLATIPEPVYTQPELPGITDSGDTGTGTGAHGKVHYFITAKEVREVEDHLTLGSNSKTILEIYDISDSVLSNIRNGKHRYSSAGYKLAKGIS